MAVPDDFPSNILRWTIQAVSKQVHRPSLREGRECHMYQYQRLVAPHRVLSNALHEAIQTLVTVLHVDGNRGYATTEATLQ